MKKKCEGVVAEVKKAMKGIGVIAKAEAASTVVGSE